MREEAKERHVFFLKMSRSFILIHLVSVELTLVCSLFWSARAHMGGCLWGNSRENEARDKEYICFEVLNLGSLLNILYWAHMLEDERTNALRVVIYGMWVHVCWLCLCLWWPHLIFVTTIKTAGYVNFILAKCKMSQSEWLRYNWRYPKVYISLSVGAPSVRLRCSRG